VKLTFTKVHIAAYGLSLCSSLTYLWTKNWTLQNLFAIAFSLQAVAMISLGRFVVAFILLTGLFFYDIFWVFGTEVMVSVATQFIGPIKIIFPVSFDPWKQSILGLGDIVIPGIFVAMCLRFDAFLHKSGRGVATSGAAGEEELSSFSSFPKPYFLRVYLSYVVSLLVTAAVMFFFSRPQPALLYLVPGTILTLLCSSHLRGDLEALWAYNEEDMAPKKKTEEAEGASEKPVGAEATPVEESHGGEVTEMPAVPPKGGARRRSDSPGLRATGEDLAAVAGETKED